MDGLSIASLFLILFAVIIIIWGIAVVHTLPGKIAKKRHHSQYQAIEITAYLGLLVFPLWMAALIWAYLVPVKLSATIETRSDPGSDPSNGGSRATGGSGGPTSATLQLGTAEMHGEDS